MIFRVSVLIKKLLNAIASGRGVDGSETTLPIAYQFAVLQGKKRR